jgi:hypothetical protein
MTHYSDHELVAPHLESAIVTSGRDLLKLVTMDLIGVSI